MVAQLVRTTTELIPVIACQNCLGDLVARESSEGIVMVCGFCGHRQETNARAPRVLPLR